MLWLQIWFVKKYGSWGLAELEPLETKENSKMLVRNPIIFIWGWSLIALSRVEHFILKQLIDVDNSKTSQRTKSLASSFESRDCFLIFSYQMQHLVKYETQSKPSTNVVEKMTSYEHMDEILHSKLATYCALPLTIT